MRRFAALFAALDETRRTSDKVALMRSYFAQADDAEASWGLWFLCGNRFRPGLKGAIFRAAALRGSGLPEWLLHECHEAAGDLSEAVALILPRREVVGADRGLDETVRRVVQPLLQAEAVEAEQMLLSAWRELGFAETLVFNKLIRGNLRIGVQRGLVIRALSEASGVEALVLAHRLSGTFEPSAEAYRALIGAGNTADLSSRPYPFCLASAFTGELGALGEACHWQIEHKWDGIRAQLLRRDGLPDGVAMWSRGEEPIARQFPELVSAARQLPAGTVLDGEVLAWRFARDDDPGGPLGFNALQSRLNRKRVEPTLFDREGVVFAAFDVLEHGGVDVRSRPLRERRAMLERLVGGLGDGPIRMPEAFVMTHWAEVAELRRKSREQHRAEGVMVKHLESRYHDGRVAGADARGIARDGAARAGWWKWKVDPYTVDAVLIAAQGGSGQRAGLFTDYTFGVWDPDPGGTLTPIAKAYSGLDHEEIRRVDAIVRANIVGRAGPVRLVKPTLVFELAFEGIQSSSRHRSGIAVRFPRIARWRTDKRIEEADTLGTMRALLDAVERGGC